MKHFRITSIVGVLALSPLPAMAQTDPAIRTVTLDPFSVTPIYLNLDLTTAIVFPKPIETVVGSGTSASTEYGTDFTFDLTEPRDALYLQCHRRNARSILHLSVDGKKFLLSLQSSATPDGMIFVKLPNQSASEDFQEITVPEILTKRPNYATQNLFRLHSFARDAMVKPGLVRKHYPSLQIRKIDDNFRSYSKCTTAITHAYRFPEDDALVFRTVLVATDEIHIDSKNLGIRIGESVYPVVFADAVGQLRPHVPVVILALIMGGPSGQRESISINNEFALTVRQSTKPLLNKPNQSKP